MGKVKNIESPEKFWEYFCSYRDEVKANPIKILEQRKSSVNFRINSGADVGSLKKEIQEASSPTIELPAQRPLTIEGFENWCADHKIIEDLGDYFKNKEGRYEDYAPICQRVKRVIRQDQIEGGMVGIYNPSITARLNGLKEQTEVEQKNTNLNVDLGSLSEEDKRILFELSMKVKYED